jgi:uncharacterized protein Yka (UPF0111/DUF47 family)
MSANALIRWLLPREDHFFTYLETLAAAAHSAALAMATFKEGQTPPAIRDRVQEIEHQGDRAVHQMLEALGRSFATPIDREDLQKLSKRMDDIIDHTNAAARACVLFGVEKPTRPMCLLADKLVESTSALATAIAQLRARAWGQLIADARRVAMLEKDGDHIYRDAMHALFHDPAIDAKTILREKEVLEDLEKAIDSCDSVADILTNLAVKNA